MRGLRSSVVVASCVAFIAGAMSSPASAQEDTTPPQLVSFTLSANHADTTASDSPEITMTAVVTDDLSGIDVVYICMTYWDTCYEADSIGNDTYTQYIYYPRYSGSGVDRSFSVEFSDRVGHEVYYSPRDLLESGINLAVSINSVSPTYTRAIALKLTKGRVSGFVEAAEESSCWYDVPLVLQLKAASGWRIVGEGYSDGNGSFRFPIHKRGKYRVTATEIGLGTPPVTTCLKASKAGAVK
jgi:hypothetical protein